MQVFGGDLKGREFGNGGWSAQPAMKHIFNTVIRDHVLGKSVDCDRHGLGSAKSIKTHPHFLDEPVLLKLVAVGQASHELSLSLSVHPCAAITSTPGSR